MADKTMASDYAGWIPDPAGEGYIAFTEDGGTVYLDKPPAPDPADKFTLLTREGEIDVDSLGPTLEEERAAGKGAKKDARKANRQARREERETVRAARKAMRDHPDPYTEMLQKSLDDRYSNTDYLERVKAQKRPIDDPDVRLAAAKDYEQEVDPGSARNEGRYLDGMKAAQAEDEVRKSVMTEAAGIGDDKVKADAAEESARVAAGKSFRNEVGARADEMMADRAAGEKTFIEEVQAGTGRLDGIMDAREAETAELDELVRRGQMAKAGEAEEEAAREASFAREIEEAERSRQLALAGASDELAAADASVSRSVPPQTPNAEFDPEWDAKKRELLAHVERVRGAPGVKILQEALEKIGLTSPEMRSRSLGRDLDHAQREMLRQRVREGSEIADELLSEGESLPLNLYEEAVLRARAAIKNTPEK